MVGAFTAGDGAVMTICAKIRGLCMVDGYCIGSPSRAGGMAAFTSVRGQWMVGGLVARAVTSAGHTIGDNGLIVRKRQYQWQPGRYRVAGLAIIQGGRMVGPFTGHSAG